MSEVGTDGMTMRDLAAASGVAPGTLYNRFGSKDQVVSMAVLDHFETVIRSRLTDYADAKTPLDKMMAILELIAGDCIRGPTFARALMSTYFKVGSEERILAPLYQALYDSWLPLIEQMHQANLLKPWALPRMLCVEMCDREFGVVMKWAQGDVPDGDFQERSSFAVLLVLQGASQGRQAKAIESRLESISDRVAKTYI